MKGPGRFSPASLAFIALTALVLIGLAILLPRMLA